MRHQTILMAMMLTLITCSAQAEEEACVENLHVIGHNVKVAYVPDNYQNLTTWSSVELKELPLSETYCDMPPSNFHLAVYSIPTLSEPKAYASSAEVLVTTEGFALAKGDYLGFTLSSDENGGLKISYSRPMKNQFNQPATVTNKLIPDTLSRRQN